MNAEHLKGSAFNAEVLLGVVNHFPVNYFIVLLPTKYLFIVMQISEYDITNEISEHSYMEIDKKIISIKKKGQNKTKKSQSCVKIVKLLIKKLLVFLQMTNS
jgi:hypothetical protein